MDESTPLLQQEPAPVPPRTVSETKVILVSILLVLAYISTNLLLGSVQQKVNDLQLTITSVAVSEFTESGIKTDITFKEKIPVTPYECGLFLIQPNVSAAPSWQFGIAPVPSASVQFKLANVQVARAFFTDKLSTLIALEYFYLPLDDFRLRIQSRVNIFGLDFPSWNWLDAQPVNGSINPEILSKKIEFVTDPGSILPKYLVKLLVQLNNTSPLVITESKVGFLKCLVAYKYTPFAKFSLLDSIELKNGLNLKHLQVETIPAQVSILNDFVRDYSDGKKVSVDIEGCTINSPVKWLNHLLQKTKITTTLPPAQDSLVESLKSIARL